MAAISCSCCGLLYCSCTNDYAFFFVACVSPGEDLADLLPNPEEILQEPLLAELAANDVFQFLLRAVYEHVRSLMEVAR